MSENNKKTEELTFDPLDGAIDRMACLLRLKREMIRQDTEEADALAAVLAAARRARREGSES
jgi:hypothetical protein